MSATDETILIVANWLLKRPLDPPTLEILRTYAADVIAEEPGTLMYRLHVGYPYDPPTEVTFPSLPPVSTSVITFVELYADHAAFETHLAHDSAFSRMVERYGDELFLAATPFGNNPSPQNPTNGAQFYRYVAGSHGGEGGQPSAGRRKPERRESRGGSGSV